MQLAELKSRINKIKEYGKKIDRQVAEKDAKIMELAKSG